MMRAMTDLIENLLDTLTAQYVLPEVATRAAASIRVHRGAGRYDGLDEPSLCTRLTEDLQAETGDRHLRVRERATETLDARTPEEVMTAMIAGFRRENFGIARAEVLDGNIGCIELRLVLDVALAGRTASAAMEFVSRTDALILDLRRCRGGSPNGVQFWSSHLFADDTVHLEDVVGPDGVRQYWTLAHLDGERYLDRPVFVLTSGETFSGGEQFAYDLQALGRATVVGETTRGGAHPTRFVPITPSVEVTIPWARPVNPVTGANWEGTGVVPDVAVPADEALDAALRRALDAVG